MKQLIPVPITLRTAALKIIHYKSLSLCYQDLSSEILVSDKLLMGSWIHKLLSGRGLTSPFEVKQGLTPEQFSCS